MNLIFNPTALVATFYVLLQEAPREPNTFAPAVLIASLYVFALAAFLGYQVISRVPPLLHTPLMSATNAISGISLIGSLVIAGGKTDNKLSIILGTVAVTSAMINVTGGFLITDRMLKMFRKKDAAKAEEKK
jgi:NAD(P) transhydrogenase subunit alpha